MNKVDLFSEVCQTEIVKQRGPVPSPSTNSIISTSLNTSLFRINKSKGFAQLLLIIIAVIAFLVILVVGGMAYAIYRNAPFEELTIAKNLPKYSFLKKEGICEIETWVFVGAKCTIYPQGTEQQAAQFYKKAFVKDGWVFVVEGGDSAYRADYLKKINDKWFEASVFIYEAGDLNNAPGDYPRVAIYVDKEKNGEKIYADLKSDTEIIAKYQLANHKERPFTNCVGTVEKNGFEEFNGKKYDKFTVECQAEIEVEGDSYTVSLPNFTAHDDKGNKYKMYPNYSYQVDEILVKSEFSLSKGPHAFKVSTDTSKIALPPDLQNFTGYISLDELNFYLYLRKLKYTNKQFLMYKLDKPINSSQISLNKDNSHVIGNSYDLRKILLFEPVENLSTPRLSRVARRITA